MRSARHRWQSRPFASLTEELEEEHARARMWPVENLVGDLTRAQAQARRLRRQPQPIAAHLPPSAALPTPVHETPLPPPAQVERLADSLPAENAAALEDRIRALQEENAELEVRLRAELSRAGVRPRHSHPIGREDLFAPSCPHRRPPAAILYCFCLHCNEACALRSFLGRNATGRAAISKRGGGKHCPAGATVAEASE